MLRHWLRGEAECIVHVAVDDADNVLGFAMTSLRPELLSHEPSAHLEAIALDPAAEGRGSRRRSLPRRDSAHAQGARTMTLHVFSVNERARRLRTRRLRRRIDALHQTARRVTGLCLSVLKPPANRMTRTLVCWRRAQSSRRPRNRRGRIQACCDFRARREGVIQAAGFRLRQLELVADIAAVGRR